jgi:DNA-binding NarL/FixJ family response regulator
MSEDAEHRKMKVVLIEDHPMFRERLTQLINRDLQMTVCGEADNVFDAMGVIERTKPDIAIVDVTLAGSSGLELIKDLKANHYDVPVLVLSMHDEVLFAERALRAGAMGYITKNQAASQVKTAIQVVLGGEVYLSPQMTTVMLRRLSKGTTVGAVSGLDSLTDRELEVFRMIGCGHNNSEIAQDLGIGETTVNSYRFRIREKLGMRNSIELCHEAVRWVKEHGG